VEYTPLPGAINKKQKKGGRKDGTKKRSRNKKTRETLRYPGSGCHEFH
jgi:hypothetical protein